MWTISAFSSRRSVASVRMRCDRLRDAATSAPGRSSPARPDRATTSAGDVRGEPGDVRDGQGLGEEKRCHDSWCAERCREVPRGAQREAAWPSLWHPRPGHIAWNWSGAGQQVRVYWNHVWQALGYKKLSYGKARILDLKKSQKKSKKVNWKSQSQKKVKLKSQKKKSKKKRTKKVQKKQK